MPTARLPDYVYGHEHDDVCGDGDDVAVIHGFRIVQGLMRQRLTQTQMQMQKVRHSFFVFFFYFFYILTTCTF